MIAGVEWNGLEVQIGLFLDGLRPTRSGMVPELVRVVDPSDLEAGRAREIERAGFCALLLRREGKPVRRARLIERTPDGEEVGRIEVTGAEGAWAARFEARLVERLSAEHAVAQRARARARLAEELAFPFSALRPGQEALLRDAE